MAGVSAMCSVKIIGLLFVGLCLHPSNGFVSPPKTSIRNVPCVRGMCGSKYGSSPTLESWPYSSNDINLTLDDVYDVDVPVINQALTPPSKEMRLRQKTKIVVPSAAILFLLAFGLPSTSHALTPIADITSIAGGASASYAAWLESLTDSGFYQAFSLVFLSEIGDKTFFVAALLAAKLSRFISFVGSLGALAVMSVISVIIGQVFHAVPSGIANGIPLDDVAAVIAFAYFGIKILSEAFEADDEGKSAMDEELEEAEETVEGSDTITKSNAWAQIASIFALVFAAEFGDRSFLATIALSAAQNPVSVAAGSIGAHAVATGIAVIGGAYISKYVSEKVIGYIGGTLFLIFALTTAIGIF